MKILVDFDSTMAHYTKGQYPELGEPIPLMVARIKEWIGEGHTVEVFTARVNDKFLYWVEPEELELALEYYRNRKEIENWTEKHIGTRLKVTNMKTYEADVIYDDLAWRVEKNTGRIVGDELCQ